MKRARGNPRNTTTTVVKEPKETKKTAKGPAAGKAKEVAKKAAEESKEAADRVAAVVAADVDDEWVGLWSGVDEEISWASCRCPFWEMEGIEDAYNALYEDVLLGYDIWDLKASANVA